MGQITEWLSEQTQSKAADKLVDDTVSNLRRREGVLDMVAPLETYDSRHFLGYVMDEINTIASVIALGQEPPATQHGTFRKINAELLKTGLSRIYDEKFQWQMREAMEEAALKRIYVQNIRDPRTGEVIRGTNNSLAKYIFGTIESLAKAQIELLDKMTWDVLQFGEINHVDPRTNIPVTISYKNPYDTSYNHFKAPLTGSDTWDNYDTANGIQDIYNLTDDFIETNGYAPKVYAISRRGMNHLLQQKSTKDAATQVRNSPVGTVGNEMLGAVLSARQLPSLITFDEMYKFEAKDKSTRNVRFMNENMIVALNPECGVRALGPTLENRGISGVHVVTRTLPQSTVVDISSSVSMMLPVFSNPKCLQAQQVF